MTTKEGLSCRPMPRDAAVEQLAELVRSRQWFLIVIDPLVATEVASRLNEVPETVFYADNGVGVVMVLAGPEAGRAAVLPLMLLGVDATSLTAVVPKTVPAKKLSGVLGRPIPDDGSQDVVIVTGPGDGAGWPTLAVDVLDRVDPGCMNAVRAEA